MSDFEDDIDDQEILEEIFSSINPSLQLQFVNNGKLLVSYFDTLKTPQLPCLIVLDYNMPGLNGAEILTALNSNPLISKIPKIIWSTSNAPAYKAKCLELGASDYLLKPSTISGLKETITRMLEMCS